MAEIEVSVSSFKKVKSSLQTFKSSISGFSFEVNRGTESIVKSCDTQIKEVKNILAALREQKNNVQRSISEAQSAEKEKSYEIEELTLQAERLGYRESELREEISCLYSQRQAIIDSASDDEDGNNSSAGLISEINGQISAAEAMLAAVKQEKQDCYEQKDKAQTELKQIQHRISELKEELHKINNQIEHTSSKLDIMTSLYKSIQSDVSQLKEQAGKLESQSSGTAGRSISNIDKCIEYLSELE